MAHIKKNPGAGATALGAKGIALSERCGFSKQASPEQGPLQLQVLLQLDERFIPGKMFAGFTSDNLEFISALQTCYLDALQAVLTKEGLRAFEMPRSAALAHETGHVIHAAHDGIRVKRVAVWANAAGTHWAGMTYHANRNKVQMSPTTSTEDMLRLCCSLMAGVIGEKVLDPDGVRAASSLDEIILSQAVAQEISLREECHVSGEDLWNACWRRTCLVINYNAAVATELIQRLALTGSVRGRPLASVLGAVRQSPGDVLTVDGLLAAYARGGAS